MMKRLLPYIWYSLPLLCILYLIGMVVWSNYNSSLNFESSTISEDIESWKSHSINPQLPYVEYKKIEDSVKREEDTREAISKSMGGGVTAGFIGVREIQDNIWDEPETTSKDATYYLQLPQYKLEQNSSFFISNNSWYIKYVVWDFISKDQKSRHGHVAKKQVRFRFSKDEKALLIPITKTAFNILKPLVMLIGIAFLIIMLYLVIGLPARVLINISKGEPFCESNIRDLYFLGVAIMSLPFFNLLGKGLLYLSFKKYMVPEVQFDFDLSSFFSWIVAGAVVLIVASAFNKGYKLQEEQALTI
jgi:hypothetical protein